MSSIRSRVESLTSAPTLLFIISIVFALVTAYMWMGTVSRLSKDEVSLETLDYLCTTDRYMNWKIVFLLNNSGGSPVIFTNVYINNMEASSYGVGAPTSTVGTITTDLERGAEVVSGEDIGITIWVGARFGFLTSGNTVRVKILCAGGFEVEKNVVLA